MTEITTSSSSSRLCADLTWPVLEQTWSSYSAPASPSTGLYQHTDLVHLLQQAQHTVDHFQRENPDLVSQIQSAHPVVMPDLASAAAFCDSSRPSLSSHTAVLADHPAPVNWNDLYCHHILKIQAPMVRCSRPAFRKVCRLWGTDVSYTHMILADSFTRSPAARHADFALYDGEDKLVVQLAAKSGPTAAVAATQLAPYCDAIDLNCGCPQRWAMRDGLGSALLEKPELVADIVRCVRNALPDAIVAEPGSSSSCGRGFPCVVKMRVKDDIRQSVEFARQCVAAGASWITVHGRTPQCAPTATVRWEAVRLLKDVIATDSGGSVPVVVNGGVSSPTETLEAALGCGVGSVMVANGLLDNPAMFECAAAPSRTSSSQRSAATCVPRGQPAHIASLAADPGAGAMERKEGTADVNAKTCAGASSSFSAPVSPVALPGLSATPLEVIADFLRAAIATDLMVPTTVQQILRMSRMYLSPAERVHVSMLRSNLSVLAVMQELGLYVEEGRYHVEW